jgi:predicted dehydrogenase
MQETAELAKNYGIVHEKNYTDLIPNVDAVSIATPTDTHYKIVKDCLLSGKHVLVEKPITLHSEEAKELVDIAEEKHLVLAVGHLFRFNPAVLKLREILPELGDVNYITMRYIHSNKPPRKDSGTVFNFAIHLFDTLNFILDATPEKIFCKNINYISDEREDCAMILLDYGGFVASIEVSWLHPLKRRDVWVIGSKEKVYVDLLNQKIAKYMIEIHPDKTMDRGSTSIDVDQREPLREELNHFIDCCECHKKPINDGMQGYYAVKLCELALQSAEEGTEVAV